MNVEFKINDKPFTVAAKDVTVEMSLAVYIRTIALLTGTKQMCREGGCGVCIVMVKGLNPATKVEDIRAVNSCLMPVLSCHGLEITTIEGLGNRKDGYNPLQQRMVDFGGTQCGFCTPGMIMSMYSMLKSKNNQVTMSDVENTFSGNICRCTGYRPILDAMKSFSVDVERKLKNFVEDIEDLKLCPKSRNPCRGSCEKNTFEKKIFLKLSNSKEWHKVFHLADIFSILRQSPNSKVILIAGNTATGVYRRDPDVNIFIDVTNVDELRMFNFNPNELSLGGNVTITESLKVFDKIATAHHNFNYLTTVKLHMEQIANVSVRNVGTLAGNLMLKHDHPDFESDIFLLFEAIGVTLIITDYNISTIAVSPVDFLKINMSGKVIVKIIFPPYSPESYIFQTYSIRPIAQNAISNVNAAFFLQINDQQQIISGTKICFGGIGQELVHATSTETQLISGQYSRDDLFKNETIQNILQILSNEINPDVSPPKVSPEYRKNVVLSLFYKFILNLCPNIKIKDSFKSGKFLLERGLSSGTQVYFTKETNYPLTQPVLKLDSIFQCSGEAKYVNDLPFQPNQLWGAFIVAKKVGYSISNINFQKALSIPGVHFIFTAKDIPGKNSFATYFRQIQLEDEEIFCNGPVLFNGQPCGIILADSHELANSTANLVEIDYVKNDNTDDDDKIYTNLKDVLEIIDFSKIERRIIELPEYSFQNLENDHSTRATRTITGRNLFKSQYHFHMETQVCLCVPNDNDMDVYSSTQWMDLNQWAIAEMLGINSSRVNIYVNRLGGSFGSKISRASQIACATALACHLTNRPIRFDMSLESNMTSIGKRWGCLSDYSVDVDTKGKIKKLKNFYYQDYGCAINEIVQLFTAPSVRNCYNNQGWNIKTYNVKTDAPKSTFCRAPGTTEGVAMTESIIEHIAFDLNLEPADVRLENFAIYHSDGSVAITHGGTEMGQGINTKAAQVAAYTLKIPLEMVSVKSSNNVTGANAFATGGSITSESVCFSVRKACQTILDRLKPVIDANPGKQWIDVVRTSYFLNIDLTASYQFKVGDNPDYNVWGVSCAEVEVDILTGKYHFTRVDIVEDVGESLSPLVDVGQVEGAFIMGMGYWLQERLVFNRENGELLTNRSWNYKPPGAKDIPIDFRVTFLQNGNTKGGFLRSKATGEPPLNLSIVCVFALRHAIDSARKDAGFPRNWYEIDYPLSPEQVFQLSGNSYKTYTIT